MAKIQDTQKMLNTTIDRNDYAPYYIQVKKALQDHIESSSWQPGDQLPGEPELCRMFNVSRTVIRQALQQMKYEGLIYREKGKGTFVAAPKVSESLFQELTGFYQDMVSRGHTPVTQVLKQEVIPADERVAVRLNLEPGAAVIAMDRLRFVQDEPIVFVTTYLPQALCPDVLEADLSQQSLYELLEQHHGLIIARGRRTLEAVDANEVEAGLLQVAKGAPLMKLNSVSYLADGTPVEYYQALHRGDRAKFEVELVRIRQHGSVKEVAGQEIADLLSSN